MDTKRKKFFIIVMIVALLFLVFISAMAIVYKKYNSELANSNQFLQTTIVRTVENQADKQPIKSTPEEINLQDAAALVKGANPVRANGKVLTLDGEETKNNVTADSALAPQQTVAIAKENLSDKVIQLNISAKGGFLPKTFPVSISAPVTISITNLDQNMSHTLVFSNPTLSAIILGAGPGETRAITFNAPTTKGEYSFFCAIPGHDGRGEEGIMTVR